MDIKGGKGIFYDVTMFKSLLLNAAGQRSKEGIGFCFMDTGEETGDGMLGIGGSRMIAHF